MDKIKGRITKLRDDLSEKEDEIDELNRKLKIEQEERQVLETTNRSLMNQLRVVEDELDQVEENLKQATIALNCAQEECDEKERELRKLGNSEQMTTDKLDSQVEELRIAKDIAEEADRKYDEISRRLVMMDSELEKAEERAMRSESENKRLAVEINELTCAAKSFEAMESSYGAKEDHAEETIRDLTHKLRESDNAKEAAEKEVQKLMKVCEDLDAEIDNVKDERNKLKASLQDTLDEMSLLMD